LERVLTLELENVKITEGNRIAFYCAAREII
jgi:hypothetical protein